MHYFDNNATTRVAPEVIEAMLPLLREHWGNPSSAYAFAKEAARRLEPARAQVARLLNADPTEIVFTSCGTESNNAAWHSALITQPDKRHILTTSVEHSANIKYAEYLRARGYEVTLLPVEPDGSLDLPRLENAIRPDTALVSVMWANNETGVVFPVAEAAALAHRHGVQFHTDAVQAAGKIRLDVQAAGVDLLSLSAHKFYAPKGVGMLYVRRGTPFHPYLMGGHQEQGRRGGTENTAYIVGMGRAAELALEHLEAVHTRVRALRDRLEQGILERIPDTQRIGAAEPRLPNTSNIAFEGIEAEALLMRLDQLGFCASSGSACSTGEVKPSHVLTAMGLPPQRAKSCVRFSFGIYNTEEEVEELLERLPEVVETLRAASPRAAAPTRGAS